MDRIDPTPPPGARRTIAVGIIRSRVTTTLRTEPGLRGARRPAVKP